MSAISVLHAPRDEAFSERLANALARSGHATQRLSGDSETGDLALNEDAFIVVWSNAALKLARVHDRAREAMARGKLIPVALGGARPPSGFDDLPPVDLSGWTGDENDPRWQFVLDEINLSVRRGNLQDANPWADDTVDESGAQEDSVEEQTPAMFEQHEETAQPAEETIAPPTYPEDEYAQRNDFYSSSPGLEPEPETEFIEPDRPHSAPSEHYVSAYAGAAPEPEAKMSVRFNLGPPPEPAPLEYRTSQADPARRNSSQISPLRAALAGSALLIVLTGTAAVMAPLFIGDRQGAQITDGQSPATPTVTEMGEAEAGQLAGEPADNKVDFELTVTRDPSLKDTTSPTLDPMEYESARAVTGEAFDPELTVAENREGILGNPVTDGSSTEEADTIEIATLVEPPFVASAVSELGSEQLGEQVGVQDVADNPETVLAASDETTQQDGPISVVTPTLASGADDALGDLVAAVTDDPASEATQEDIAEEAATEPQLTSAVEVLQSSASARFFKECSNCPEMAAISTGVFLMGSPLGERSRLDVEGPQLMVGISKRFAIGTREITFAQWDACAADGGCRAHRPSDQGWGRGNQPVINVSFADAQNYTRWLSAKTGATYRLPSEAEWEYAARGGSEGAFAFGGRISTDQANFNGNYPYGGGAGTYRRRTIPVAALAPNAFGLYDMHGNVWEWTADCWYGNHVGASVDGTPRDGACGTRVLKGGAWNTGGWRLRSAHRIGKDQTAREFDNGFRVVRELN